MKTCLGPVLRRAVPMAEAVAREEALRTFDARRAGAKMEMIQTVLGHLFPGQDVHIRARNREQRRLIAGYWVWSMTELKHVYTDRKRIFEWGSGRDPKLYRKQVRHRNLRWSDFVREYEKVTGQTVINARDAASAAHL